MKFLLVLLLLSAIQYNDGSLDKVQEEEITSETYYLENIAKQSSFAAEDDEINKDCLEDLQDIVKLNGSWTLRMIDSAGKIPHGILRGNLASIGQYRECIETSFERPSGREITGRHCMVRNTLKLPSQSEEIMFDNISPAELWLEAGIRNEDIFESPITRNGSRTITITTGICFPSSCSPQEINKILSLIPSDFPLKANISDTTCSTQRKIELSPGNIGTISFLSVIGFIMLCSTLYDLWYKIVKKGDIKEQSQLFVAFSVYTNSQRLFTPSKNPGPLACLHGIRVISILWIVLGHRYLAAGMTPLENFADYLEWFKDPGSAIIAGSTVSVDTFFLMSGILLSYTFFRSAKMKNIGKDLPMFYIHRILRLTPLLAVIVLLFATLISLYGNGPYKYVAESQVRSCQENWWATLLYVQNYAVKNICVGQTWYLAVDMQLYIISPLLLYPLLWNEKVGIVWTSILIAGAQSIAFALAYVNEWPAGMFNRGSMSALYQINYYIPTHTRATPYFIGLLAGYLIFHSFRKNKITTIQYNYSKQTIGKQCLIIIGWIFSLTILGAVLFGYHPLNQTQGYEFSHWRDTTYNAFSRTGWAIALLWIIVACAYGFGGPINWFLSLTVWEILGRFSYAVYLIHMGIQLMLVTNKNHIPLYDQMNIIYEFFGDGVICLAIAYVLILAFESPIAILEKIIFKRGKIDNSQKVIQNEKLDQLPYYNEEKTEKVRLDGNV